MAGFSATTRQRQNVLRVDASGLGTKFTFPCRPVFVLLCRLARPSAVDVSARNKILQMGGNSNGAVVIDINPARQPTVTATRVHVDPKRDVGQCNRHSRTARCIGTGGSEVDNKLTGVNNDAGNLGPRQPASVDHVGLHRRAVARLYHSNCIAVAQCDGTGRGRRRPGTVSNNTNAEIYQPPYLLRQPTGTWRRGPQIVDRRQLYRQCWRRPVGAGGQRHQ